MSIIEILRQHKVGPFSIFDFTITFIAAFVLAPYLIRFLQRHNIRMTKANVFWLVIPLSVLAHVLTGTSTPLTLMAFDPSSHLAVKIMLLVMIYLGLRDVRHITN